MAVKGTTTRPSTHGVRSSANNATLETTADTRNVVARRGFVGIDGRRHSRPGGGGVLRGAGYASPVTGQGRGAAVAFGVAALLTALMACPVIVAPSQRVFGSAETF